MKQRLRDMTPEERAVLLMGFRTAAEKVNAMQETLRLATEQAAIACRDLNREIERMKQETDERGD